jgi:hypothetical protein
MLIAIGNPHFPIDFFHDVGNYSYYFRFNCRLVSVYGLVNYAGLFAFLGV